MPYTNHWYGLQEWTDNEGRPHRENGPARKWADGNKEYFIHGVYHREDGPSYIWSDSYEYRVNGKLHNLHGLARHWSRKRIIGMLEVNEYWINGVKMSKEEWNHARKEHLTKKGER
jgi:hypothetical protein